MTVLARYSMGPAALAGAAIVASSPQTVLNGGIPATYAVTGAAGVPLSFLVIMTVMAILAVPYVAVGRHVPHGAPFYAQLARGTNPTWGLVGAAVTLIGYSALQASLYPLLGATVSGLVGAGEWWMWALIAWLIVLLLGQYPGAVGARVLGVLLALEIAVVLLFILAGFTHPAPDSGTAAGAGLAFAPSSLIVAGATSTLLVYAAAAFAGTETAMAYAEEATSHRAMAVGSALAIGGGGVLYCFASWAYGAWIGFGNMQNGPADAGRQPLALLGEVYGNGIAELSTLLLVTSILAAQSSFGAAIARNVFALAREGVLPAAWQKVSPGAKGGAPLGGTAVQAVTSAVVLTVMALAGADPMATIFPWLSTIGAVCVLALLTATSWSAFTFFEKGLGGSENVLVRRVCPVAGGTFGVLALFFMAGSVGTLLGTEPGSSLPWLVAAVIGAGTLTAVLTGRYLRHTRPAVYQGIGRGIPDGRTVLDPALEDIEV
ncbi:APC family permease [Actinoplanes sichuanensis]|uniref:APC family permease n=1 Tax=Actinoplanes sichuanensis TaxID=512349 RepID=A0ABW4A618_9ACTN|nr:APC family permease [Actinoplanes sichuanensis]